MFIVVRAAHPARRPFSLQKTVGALLRSPLPAYAGCGLNMLRMPDDAGSGGSLLGSGSTSP